MCIFVISHGQFIFKCSVDLYNCCATYAMRLSDTRKGNILLYRSKQRLHVLTYKTQPISIGLVLIKTSTWAGTRQNFVRCPV